MALQPKPITLTSTAVEDYEGAAAPQPFTVIGGISDAIDTQPAIASPTATPATFTTLAEAREEVHENRLKIDEILTALRAAGVIAP